MSTRKQTNVNRAVSLALAGEPVQAIADTLGVSRETASRYLHSDAGKKLLADGREAMLAEGRDRLTRLVGAAVAALGRNLDCGLPAVEAKTAVDVLKLAGLDGKEAVVPAVTVNVNTLALTADRLLTMTDAELYDYVARQDKVLTGTDGFDREGDEEPGEA